MSSYVSPFEQFPGVDPAEQDLAEPINGRVLNPGLGPKVPIASASRPLLAHPPRILVFEEELFSIRANYRYIRLETFARDPNQSDACLPPIAGLPRMTFAETPKRVYLTVEEVELLNRLRRRGDSVEYRGEERGVFTEDVVRGSKRLGERLVKRVEGVKGKILRGRNFGGGSL